MILYHYTALAHLIGKDGFADLKRAWDTGAPEAVNGAAFAAPGSILKAELRPHNNGENDMPLGGPTPPHVWLTTNPDMSNDFVTGNTLDRGNWRITVVIPSADRRLVYWPKYFSKRTGGDYVISSEDRAHAYRLAREATGFYLYFGAIPLDRFRAVENVADNRLARAAA